MCRLLGVSKQAYYKHEDKLVYRLAREAFVVEFVKEIRRKAPGMGGCKLWQMYNRRFGEKWHVGFNRFYDILECHGLKLRRRRRRALTTDSRHGLPFYPNLVKELIPDAPCQLIVSDITYIVYGTNPGTGAYSFCYLSLVTDYYTKEIVGYSVGETLETRYPLEALEMALRHYEGMDLSGLIHHSDRGIQYASYAYTERLKKEHIRISMTESGNGMSFRSVRQVREAVKTAVDFYNNERPHWSLDGMTPVEASRCRGELRKRWVSYREEAIKRQMPPPMPRQAEQEEWLQL